MGDHLVDISDPDRRSPVPQGATGHDLLVPVFQAGRRIAGGEPLSALQARAKAQVGALAEAVTRLDTPDPYPVGLSERLSDLKQVLMARGSGE